jgi:hypothetical protein
LLYHCFLNRRYSITPEDAVQSTNFKYFLKHFECSALQTFRSYV